MGISSETMFEINDRKLPRRIRELIRLIGIRETLRLLEKHGGSAKYIPKKITATCELLKVISLESLRRLSEQYNGETIDLPKADHIHRQIRNMEIIKKSRNGNSRCELVKEYRLSRRQIGNIRREYGDN